MSSLEERIKMYPLTRNKVELILEKKIKQIQFRPLFQSGLLIRNVVVINSSLPEEEQKITLIHEISHIYYRIMGIENRTWEGEELLEKEAKRFYDSNTEFVEEIYKRIKEVI